MSIKFFQTMMGRKYYESTMPSLIRELERLNTNIEKLIEQNKKKEVKDEK